MGGPIKLYALEFKQKENFNEAQHVELICSLGQFRVNVHQS